MGYGNALGSARRYLDSSAFTESIDRQIDQQASNWKRATEPRCPYCGEVVMIEQVGLTWFCQVCARTWT